MKSPETHLQHSLVTAILPRQSGGRVVDATLAHGVPQVMTMSARGTLLQDRWYQSLLPAISPEQEILYFLVPNEEVDTLMEQVVMEGKLRRFGAGSIFALPCEELVCSDDFPLMLPGRYSFEADSFDIQFQTAFAELVHITDRGSGEPIARAAIKAGAQGATITYVRGYGLRDRLGLLRITKSHEKELVVVVVDEYDRDAVFEAMAMAGHVDQPGRGLVYQLPLGKGIANLSSVFHARKHSASIQQMVRAIDELQGNTDWRANQLLVHDPKAGEFADNSRCLSRDLKRLKILSRRKDVEVLISALLDYGIPGASVSNWRSTAAEREETLGKVRLHREFGSISLILPPGELDGLCKAVRQTMLEHEMPETCYFVNTVPRMKTFSVLGD